VGGAEVNGFLPPMSRQAIPPAEADALFYHACLVVGAGLLLLTAALAWLRWRRDRAIGAPSGTAPAAPGPTGWVLRLRETLAVGLAAFWILDGFLQMQPLMVTRFIGGFLTPMLQGQPGWVQSIIRVGIHIWGISPIWWNVGATFAQIMLGVGLLLSRDGSRARRTVLWLSLGWCLVVWTAGEAFGSLFDGGGVVSGSPGSVFFYGMAAVLLLLPARGWTAARLQGAFRWGMVLFFSLLAFLQAWPANGWWTPTGLSGAALSMAGMPQPAWIAAPLSAWAATLKLHPVTWNALWLASELALAAAWWLRPRSRATFWTTAAWNLIAWYLWQDFGVLGGMGTDPNTGGIFFVFLLVYGRLVGHLLPLRRDLRTAAADVRDQQALAP
jgi:hypothetical protein